MRPIDVDAVGLADRVRAPQEQLRVRLLLDHVGVERQRRRDLDHRDRGDRRAMLRRQPARDVERLLGLGVVGERNENRAIADVAPTRST